MIVDHQDYLVAVTMATEVPPVPTGTFTEAMIPLALKAVSEVIRTRAEKGTFGGPLPVDVVLSPHQFSAVCVTKYWRDAIAGRWAPAHVQRALNVWRNAPTTLVPGATHYYSPVSMSPKDSVPDFVKGMTEVTVTGLDREYFRFYR